MYIFLLTISYLFLRLLNLTKIPIFNDEAIYLDWGWREVHFPNSLYYSLFDGKQPLLMWVFGFMQNYFDDPLLAGRLVSVLTGLATLFGLYILVKKLYDKKIAFIASGMYIITPIFSFFDRQALMESSIGLVLVWSTFAYISLIEKHEMKYVVLLGVMLGLGFFIKSTTLLFIFSFFIITILVLFHKNFQKKISNKSYLIDLIFSGIISLMVIFPLLSQQQYWETLHLNNRFSFSSRELLSFPVSHWISNIIKTLEITFWHVTPPFFLLFIYGILTTYKSKSIIRKIVLLLITLNVVLFIMLTKSPSPRYLASLLPLTLIYIAVGGEKILDNKNVFCKMYFYLCLTCAFGLVTIQILTPIRYFSLFEKVTRFSLKTEYVTSWTSGYGIPETIDFLKEKKKPIIVGVRVDSGNPESAILTYFHSSKNVKPGYFDAALINTDLSKIDCITFPNEFYFVSRGSQFAGMEKYLLEVKRFNKPGGEEFVGVYTMKPNCKGRSLKMSKIL